MNVHTPNVNAAASLPVMIFIHGGAYMYGSGSLYEASHIMDKDVVVVTLNYRLGPLGKIKIYISIVFSASRYIPRTAG